MRMKLGHEFGAHVTPEPPDHLVFASIGRLVAA
jgi:hypothetical protein